ncbi:39S ribosomal protein L20, mitochondrial-like [Salmo salar]|uniref:39S ribosomal protein L20, mitochondrial-like n=1 Tax=Salmo salar TaxID=8030 RepID=A0A1S3P3X3_SALSA|nr:39S ribosomal protein L20, mitochondrial-like [Salmo salar]|eukprot:XP_014022322.1 PREDICTED: 39S ribosomal protein L20, mitochondrial-like [Salmo salar]
MNLTPNSPDTLVVCCHPFCPFLSSVFLFSYLCVHQHFRGRKNRCYRLAVRRAFVYATKALKIKRRNMRMSREHSMKYPTLMHNLVKSSVLSDHAITEPKSFLSLAMLVRARQQEGFGAALGDGKEPPGVISRIITLQ